MAIWRRTNDAQWSCSTRTSDHLDLLTVDNFATRQTVTFIIQRSPRSKLVETLQYLEFIFFHLFKWSKHRHYRTMTDGKTRTIRRWNDSRIGENPIRARRRSNHPHKKASLALARPF